MQVHSLEDLDALVKQKRAVVSKLLDRPYPAAWIINYPGAAILGLIKAGLYRYEKRRKEKTDED